MKAKMLGYQFSKFAMIGIVAVGLLGAGTFQVFASGNHNNKPSNIQKSVKARVSAHNSGGGSNSHASVDNSVRVNIGGGGGSAPSLNRNNNNGNNHKNNNGGNNKKKVVRRDVTHKTVDNSYTDNSFTDNSTNVAVDQTQTNTCGDCYNTDTEYNYTPSKQHPSYDHTYDNKDYTYDNNDEDYNYNDNRSYDNHDVKVINNNNNENNNDNSQYLRISLPQYHDWDY